MKVIDSYVYAVVKRLPEKSRAEVERELRANIEDMLPDQYEETDVHKVLLSLGNPAVLAEQYREGKRYLIGPELYGNYSYVLKIVSIVALFAIPAVSILTVLMDTQGDGPFELLLRMLVEAIAMAFQLFLPVFGAVTLIFACLERADKKHSQWPYTGKPWTIKDLEEAPASKTRTIPKSEPILSIATSVIFAIALCFFPELIGLYMNENGVWDSTPLFVESELRFYVPFLLALTTATVILATLKLIQQRWTSRLAGLNVVLVICNIAFVCALFLNSDVVSDDFLSTFAANVNSDLEPFRSGWETGVYILTAFLTISMVWDGINGVLKSRKP